MIRNTFVLANAIVYNVMPKYKIFVVLEISFNQVLNYFFKGIYAFKEGLRPGIEKTFSFKLSLVSGGNVSIA